MQALRLAAIAFGWFALQPPADNGQIRHVYILRNERTHQWCGYHDSSTWKRRIEEVEALEVASITSKRGYPVQVDWTVEDEPEAGDWRVFESYRLDERGAVISLQRTTNILPDDVQRIETYRRRNGGLVRLQAVYRSLRTGKPLSPVDLEVPKRALIGRLNSFPFRGVLGALRRSPLATEACEN